MAWHYRPQLDGLRTVAVYLVVLFHAGITLAGGGFIGVDLFFVLSGFLVTNVILSEQDEHGRFGLGRFYSRRVRRLLPAAVVVIVLTCLLQLLVVAAPSRAAMVHDARASLLYVANWQFIADASDYFGDGRATSPFLHFWSLSIEEQFYVVFPVLLWLVLVRLRRSERLLGAVLGSFLVASVLAQVITAAHDVNTAYYATHTRIYQLLAGALLALVLRGRAAQAPDARARLAWAVAATVGVVAVVVLATDRIDLSQSQRGLWATAASVAAIGGVVLAPRSYAARVLARPLPRYLGQISYGTYLWHWPVILLLDAALPMPAVAKALAAGLVATGLASLSFQVFETPIRRTPRIDPFAWPVVAAGLATSLLAALVVVGPVLHSDARPSLAAAGSPQQAARDLGGQLAWTSAPVPSGLPLVALKDDEGSVGADCASGDPSSCVVVDGPPDEPLVMLIGDSHAGMLEGAFAKLAEEHHFRLATDIRNKCAWTWGIHNESDRDSNIRACRSLRDDLYEHVLPALRPDLVVLTQRARDGAPKVVRDIRADDAAQHPGEPFHRMLQRRITATLGAITRTGARAVVLHSMFGTGGWRPTGFDPLDCLATARTQGGCAVTPVLPPPLDSLYDAAAATDDGVYAAELRGTYCPAVVLCAPVVDGIVTWKDHGHLSQAFTEHIRAGIWQTIAETGALTGLGTS